MQRYFGFIPHCPKNVFRILGCSHHADLTIGTLYRVSSVTAAHFLTVKSNNHIVVLEAHVVGLQLPLGPHYLPASHYLLDLSHPGLFQRARHAPA